MKIWFGTTTSKLAQFHKEYFAIRNYLVQNGHILLFDWLDDAMKNMRRRPEENRNIKDIYEDILQAITNCDVSIIEFTVPNFSSSHQINYSLFKQKPTLVMRLNKDNTFTDSYIEAINSPFLIVREYTPQTMHHVIDEFIGYSQLETGQGRYNIVLDKKQKQYLDWASTTYNQSKSAIIREEIDKRMENDTRYKRYIAPTKNSIIPKESVLPKPNTAKFRANHPAKKNYPNNAHYRYINVHIISQCQAYTGNHSAFSGTNQFSHISIITFLVYNNTQVGITNNNEKKN